MLRAHVHSVEVEAHDEKVVNVVAPGGVVRVRCRALIYAVGARERTIFEIGVVGDRPAGIFTAGEAQLLMDLYGVLPGREVVIVGSGDVGLIMARRFALEGARVKAVVEIMPWPGGLMRNVVQCCTISAYPSCSATRSSGSRGGGGSRGSSWRGWART